jgi:hypothetical protein
MVPTSSFTSALPEISNTAGKVAGGAGFLFAAAAAALIL